MPDCGPLLALETSVPTARVALLAPDGAVRAAREQAARRHSSNLLRLVDETLQAERVSVAALGGIACGAGPGSFTGLRVGLAVAKGLALPWRLPLVLVSSLEALAHDLGADVGTLLLPCLDAGKGQVHLQPFLVTREGRQPRGEPVVLTPEDVWSHVRDLATAAASTVMGGTGAERYADLFRAALGPAAVRTDVPGPSAVSVGRLGQKRLRRGESSDLEGAVPFYGRPPDITRPKAR